MPPRLMKPPAVRLFHIKDGFVIEGHGKNGRTGPDTEDEMSVYDVG